MKVLVTGGAGFIGSHITQQCIEQGYDVIVIDNLQRGKKEYIHPKAKFIYMDILDKEISHVFKEEKPEVVIHQAAQIDVQQSILDPVFDAENNIIGTINLLEACRSHQIKKVIYASTAAVYGDPIYLPIDEQHLIQPMSGYGVSKYTVERYISLYHHYYGLKYTILRYANVYGIRQDPHGEGGVVSIFIDKALNHHPMTIYGDGLQTRDFIDVSDVAKANIAAIEYGDNAVLNIGTGVQTSLRSLVKLISKVSAKQLQVTYEQERCGDIRNSFFTSRLAEEVLCWNPQVSLEKGLKNTYEYYQSLYDDRTLD